MTKTLLQQGFRNNEWWETGLGSIQEQSLARVAAAQLGLVTRTQALDIGLSTKAVEWKLVKGEWLPIRRSVYRLASHPVTWEQTALASCLSHGDGVALSHRTAGFIHRLDGVHRADAVELLLPRGQQSRVAGVIGHRSAAHFDIVRVRGLPVTNLARTVLDLASALEPGAFERALDSAQRQRPNLGPWLGYVMKELGMRGPPGVARVKELLAVRLGLVESSLETDVTRALRRANVIPWKHQYTVCDGQGRYIVRADFAWPRHRVVLHADSFNWHRHRHQFDRDRAQRNALTDAGWEELVVTSTALASDEWLHQLQRLLDNRAAQHELPLSGVGTARLRRAR